MRLLTDEDVAALAPAEYAATMERAVRAHAAGELRAPPRWSVEALGDGEGREGTDRDDSGGPGDLVFTCGVTPDALGFRVYETLGTGEGHTQLTVVWDGHDGRFRGIVEGHRLGIARTAGINGVAIDHLARDDASTLGVLGTGPQSRMGARVACAVREFDSVRVFSPTREHRETFAEKMPEKLGVPVEVHDSAEPVVRGADVLYVATDARSPVFEADWVREGTHVCTLGPKFEGAHEVPLALAERASAVVTDSLAQVDGYADYRDPLFLPPERFVELGDVVAAGVERDPTGVTLFCSVGLAGTEVVLADRLLAE
jgi:ornithine cyclodeaminase/alanine dehydrogenase